MLAVVMCLSFAACGGKKVDYVIAVGPMPMMRAVANLTREDKIKTEAIQIPSGKLVVISKNENKVGVDLNIEVEFLGYVNSIPFSSSTISITLDVSSGPQICWSTSEYDSPWILESSELEI